MRIDASGRLAFTDHTAWRDLAQQAFGARLRAADRERHGPVDHDLFRADSDSLPIVGQYTVAGAGS